MAQSNKAYQLEESENGEVFGELDVKKQHSFPKGWMGRVVVRQVDVMKAPSGAHVEDPGTVKVMNYETEVFEKLERNKLFDSNIKVTILHDPR